MKERTCIYLLGFITVLIVGAMASFLASKNANCKAWFKALITRLGNTLERDPGEQLDYTFILVAYGNTPPLEKSYQGDTSWDQFKENWIKKSVTQKGTANLDKVGESLKKRYKRYLNTLEGEQIRLTITDHNAAKETVIKIQEKVLSGTKHEQKFKDLVKKGSVPLVEVDSYIQHDGGKCPWLDKIFGKLNSKLKTPGDNDPINIKETLEYCSPAMHSELNRELLKDDPSWKIKSLEDVYNIFKIYRFKWAEGIDNDNVDWYRVTTCVTYYLRLKMTYNDDVTGVLAGALFGLIKEEKEKQEVKFHIHATDSKTMTDFIWNLPGDERNVWMDCGDGLILDFFKDGNVVVTNFSKWENDGLITNLYTYEDIKSHISKAGLDLSLEKYKEKCSSN